MKVSLNASGLIHTQRHIFIFKFFAHVSYVRIWCVLKNMTCEQVYFPILQTEIVSATKFYLGVNFYN